MRYAIAFGVVLSAICGFGTTVQASLYYAGLPMGKVFSASSPGDIGTFVYYGMASFEQDTDVSTTTVQMTLHAYDGESSGDLPDGAFISSFYFNLNPAYNATGLTIHQLSGVAPTDIGLGTNAFKADGDGYFDVRMSFGTAEGNRFAAGDTAVFEISRASGLTVNDLVKFTSVDVHGQETGEDYPYGYVIAAHVQGLSDEASQWINLGVAKEVSQTPEPTALVVWALLGAVALIGWRWKRTA